MLYILNKGCYTLCSHSTNYSEYPYLAYSCSIIICPTALIKIVAIRLVKVSIKSTALLPFPKYIKNKRFKLSFVPLNSLVEARFALVLINAVVLANLVAGAIPAYMVCLDYRSEPW